MSLDHPESETARRLLVELGLTGTEAEVYCAALQLGATEPLSSYRLAQAMGRDPANVGKTLAALVRAQAVSIVQEKPRLYLPTPPEAFATRLRDRVSRHGREAVAVLELLRGGAPGPSGYAQALDDADAVFARARRMLDKASATVLAWGSKTWLREVGADLEAAAEDPACRVRILSPVAMVAEHAEIAVAPRELVPPGGEFLQLVIDETAWLCAGGGDGPVGCWAEGSGAAPVMGAPLAAMFPTAEAAPETEVAGSPESADASVMQAADRPDVEDPDPSTPPSPEPEPEPEPKPVPGPPPDPEPDPVREPGRPLPATEPDPEPEPEGLTFLVRHGPKKERGEP